MNLPIGEQQEQAAGCDAFSNAGANGGGSKNLNTEAFGGFLRLIIAMATSLFLPAWTLDYWQAWMFLAVFSMLVLAITVYLMKNDPELLERRIHAGSRAENERSQRIIQFLAAIAFIALFILPAIDHRFAWSNMNIFLIILGDIIVALGFLIVFLVFKENTFTSATIEVSSEQKVISTGPYALVRHPMYIGALVMLSGVPLALGSWWGMLMVIPMTLVIVWRLLDEETFLARNLPGYSEYRNEVRYRLVPFLW
jgi:protein-S-isoprenylcysteine O-methyltransferase Ste14